MSNILITGAFGFVGSQLALALLGAGHKVKLFDLPQSPNRVYFEHILAHKFSSRHYEITLGDLRNLQDVDSAVNGCDCIIHAASLLNSHAPYDTFYSINVIGTDNLCQSAITHGVKRFILISTSDVFGIPEPDQVITESNDYRPWNEPYADTKILAAEKVKQYRRQGLLNASIIYPGWVYGKGDRQFFPAIIDLIKQKWVYTWHKDKEFNICLINIEDLISGILSVMALAPSCNDDFLLLDDASHITPSQLYALIAEFYQLPIRIIHIPYSIILVIACLSQWMAQKNWIEKPLLTTTDVKAFGHSFRFNTVKARTQLNWSAKVSVKEGIKQALEWQQRYNVGD